jgi:RimJ/RimL family protein N-acetyltransferase
VPDVTTQPGRRPARLETDRLVLRAFELDDGPARLRYQGRDDVSRYLFRDPLDATSVLVGIRHAQEGVFEKKDDRVLLAVTLGADGTLVGEVSARLDSVESGQVEIGWVFDPDHAGHGYATEAAAALMQHLFRDGGAHRVFARLDADNTASARLCERLGMSQEAHLVENELWHGRWTSELIFARLAP